MQRKDAVRVKLGSMHEASTAQGDTRKTSTQRTETNCFNKRLNMCCSRKKNKT